MPTARAAGKLQAAPAANVDGVRAALAKAALRRSQAGFASFRRFLALIVISGRSAFLQCGRWRFRSANPGGLRAIRVYERRIKIL